jgi:methylglutamate dehydrogenase subunit B
MRIPCPFCGDRDVAEYVYHGDASAGRPHDAATFFGYVYLRDNPGGLLEENWYHLHGCHNWLIVLRNTLNHAIVSTRFANEASQ